MNQFIIQSVGFLALLILLASFQCRSSQKLFVMQLISNAVYMLHFLLMGAYSACASLLISCLRNVVLVSKGTWAGWKGWPWAFIAVNIVSTMLTWESVFSLLPCIGVISLTMAGWTRNGKTIRLANLFAASPAWLIFDFYSGSYSGILCELLSMGSVIVSVLRYGWKALDTVESPDFQEQRRELKS